MGVNGSKNNKNRAAFQLLGKKTGIGRFSLKDDNLLLRYDL